METVLVQVLDRLDLLPSEPSRLTSLVPLDDTVRLQLVNEGSHYVLWQSDSPHMQCHPASEQRKRV